MKIAILTQPLIGNYGGILQNYALQTVLKKLGHEVQTLHVLRLLRRYRRLLGKLYDLYIKFKNILNAVLRREPYLNQKLISADEKKLFLSNITAFVNEHINCTTPITDISQLKNYTGFEAYIVGSDQVWRPSYSPDIYTYFLEFVSKNSSAKKIAYAASFGTSRWLFSPLMTMRCKKSAARLNAISVREYTGIELCRKHLNRNAVQVPDPTLLLAAEDYRKLFSAKNLSGKGKLVTYILDNSPEKEHFVQKTASEMNLEVLALQKEYAPGVQKLAIEDWLSAISDAEYVITDSFHGTVFSIIFERQFSVINNIDRGQDRFFSLLNQLHLSERLTDTSSSVPESVIDYSVVNTELQSYRQTGYEFLKENEL